MQVIKKYYVLGAGRTAEINKLLHVYELRNEQLKQILGKVLFPQAIVLDPTRFKYVWGDGMAMFLTDFMICPVVQAISAGGETKKSLESVQGISMWTMPVLETSEEAIGHVIEVIENMRKAVLSFNCPKCGRPLQGSRLTRYRCPKWNTVFLIGVSSSGDKGSHALLYSVSSITVNAQSE